MTEPEGVEVAEIGEGDFHGEAANDVLPPPTPEEPPFDEPVVLKGDYELQDGLGDLPQLTLAVIKPDGMDFLTKIERRIREEGFTVAQKRRLLLTPEQASDLYYEHYGQEYFPSLVATMCTGPIQVYVLSRKDSVDMWRHICGPWYVEDAKRDWPESLRALYGTEDEPFKNVCHASATVEKALEEIRFFFPKMFLDPNFRTEVNAEDFLKEFVNPTLTDGLAQLCKHKPQDPVTWLAEWLLNNNPNKPRMCEPITLTAT